MTRFMRRCAGAVWHSLVAFGAVHVGPWVLLKSGRILGAPPPGSPERLVPDQPLTAREQIIAQELTGDGGPLRGPLTPDA